MKKLLFGLTLLASLPGFAYNDFVTCSTSSNGYSFSDESRDPNVAADSAVRSCTAHSRTSNPECVANVACDDGGVIPPMLTCSTSSNGYSFADESRDPSVARAHALAQCTAHSRTSNVECSANISCNDGSLTPPMLTCTTSSNGYSFDDESRIRSVAVSQAVAQCTAHSRTSNEECTANVSCNDGSYVPPMQSCSTSSNGYSFSDESRDQSVAYRHTLAQCTAHSRTSNAECSANIICDGPAHRPRPEPRPRPEQPDYDYYGRNYSFRNLSIHMAERLITIIEVLEPYANGEEYSNILLPIKDQAGSLKSRIQGRAELERVRVTLIQISNLLGSADAYIEDLKSRDALFDKGVELETIKEKVRSLLRAIDERAQDNNTDLY